MIKKNKILVTGGSGRFGKILKKQNFKDYFFPNKKELNITNIKSIKNFVQKTKPEIIIEAAITPGSFLIGRSLNQTNVESEVNCEVVGVQRGISSDIETLSSLKLNAGNILLLKGSEKSIRSLRGIKDIFPIEWSTIYLPSKLFALRARLIFVATIFLASSGIFNITAAAVMGASNVNF